MEIKKEKVRDIIYVDAGGADGSNDIRNYKISLYHPNSYKTECVDLDCGLTTYEAECYGILNAIVYAITNELENVMICCDNKIASENIKLIEFANQYGIKITWIPRELNQIAYKSGKLEQTSTKKNKTKLNNLKIIYNLVLGK